MKSFVIYIQFVVLSIGLTSFVQAQIPAGYYDDAIGLQGEELKQSLHEIINDHEIFSYNDLRDFILRETDEDPNNSNNVILLYTGRSQAKSSFGGGANDWNREHVWAKSHGDFGNTPPAGTDAHHIRPTDASVNSARGNKDFAEGGQQHSEATGCYYTQYTWEPRNAVKGDVARMIFYMAVRYEGGDGVPDLEVVDHVNTSPNPEHGKLQKLLDWHLVDPPDDFERNRNEVIYSYQDNRNPFIDHPEFVEAIWGDPNSVSNTDDVSLRIYPNPAINDITISHAHHEELYYYCYSLDGRQMQSYRLTPGNQDISIDQLPPGMYFVVLQNINGRTLSKHKLIKTTH